MSILELLTDQGGNERDRRVLIYLLLDVSGSMCGAPINAVHEGIELLLRELKRTPDALETAHLSIITYGSDARVLVPMQTVAKITVPTLPCGGSTNTAAALELVARLIDIDFRPHTPTTKGDYRPLLFLLTDGEPDDLGAAIKSSKLLLNRPVGKAIGGFWAIGCGPHVNTTNLKQIAKDVFTLTDVTKEDIQQAFTWLTASIITASRSTVESGEQEKKDATPISLVDAGGQVFVAYLQSTPNQGSATGDIFLTTDRQYVVKVYHSNFNANADFLTRIVKAGPKNDIESQYLAWPSALVMDENFKQVIGIVFPNPSLSGWLKEFSWYRSFRSFSQLPKDQRGNFLGRVKISSQIAASVRYIIRLGFVHQDLSNRTLLINPVEGRTVLIGLDELIVPGYVQGFVLGTPEYMSPELVEASTNEGKITPNVLSNRHSFAVLLYELLLMRHPLVGSRVLDDDPEKDDCLQFGPKALYSEHPTDICNHPNGMYISADVLGSELAELFKRSFVDGLHDPNARPFPDEYELALKNLMDDLIACPNSECLWGYFPSLGGTAKKCPMCGTEITNDQVQILENASNQIFVSYSRADWEKYVRPMVETLRKEGISVWIDQHLLEGGQDWLDEINDALRRCRAMVLCVSPDAIQSKWVKMEYRYFVRENKPILPIVCRQALLPVELGGIHYVPYNESDMIVKQLKRIQPSFT